MILLALKHAKASLRVTINFYSAFFFLFYIKKPLYFPTMCFSVLCWNILSIITTNSAVMVLASIILIYPFYIVDHLQVVVTNLEVDNVEKVLAPFTVYTYPIIIVLISLYMAFTMTENEDGVSTLFSEEILKLSEKNKFNDNTYLRYIQAITDFVKDPLERIYRYFTLLMAIFTALHFISILSTILVIFGLILIWKTDGDKKYWKWFTCYTVFHIIIKQLGHYIVKEEMYNTEFMALIGIIGVEKEPDSIYSLRRLMLLDYILIFLSCTWYWRIQFKETQELLQKDQSNGLKGLKNLAFSHVNTNILRIFRAAYTFASMMVNYYSIWIYHISANLVLLSEPRDVVTIVMLSLEILTTFVHIAIWKKSGVHPYKSVYRVWAPNFYLVVLYALVRYLTFFLQYIHARDFYVEVLNLAGFEGKKIIEEKIENMLQVNSYSYQYYVKSYFKLLLLVSVAVYTRNSLLSVIEANDKDAEEKLNRLLKESLSKDSNQVLKQITGTKPDLSSRLSVSSRKSGESDILGFGGRNR